MVRKTPNKSIEEGYDLKIEVTTTLTKKNNKREVDKMRMRLSNEAISKQSINLLFEDLSACVWEKLNMEEYPDYKKSWRTNGKL